MEVKVDVLVIGRGIAGTMAAATLAKAGKKVAIVARGYGATALSSGCMDILGYVTEVQGISQPPLSGLKWLSVTNKRHPYLIAAEGKKENVEPLIKEAFENLPAPIKDLYTGSIDSNMWVITSFGTLRPTAFVQKPMKPAVVTGEPRKVVITGIRGLFDLNPVFAASMLAKDLKSRSMGGVRVKHAKVSIKGLEMAPYLAIPLISAALEDDVVFDDFKSQLVSIAKSEEPDVILLPPIFSSPLLLEKLKDLEEACGCEVGEVPSPPANAAGIRLQRALSQVYRTLGIRVFQAMEVVPEVKDSRVVRVTGIHKSVLLEEIRKMVFEAEDYVLATGDFIGEGLICEVDDELNRTFKEAVFNLPLYIPEGDMASPDPFTPAGQNFSKIGVMVNSDMQPVDHQGNVVYENLYAAGSIIGCYDYVAEKSGMGVAITTAFKAAKSILSKKR